jgi:hypothetical protein
MQLYEYPLLRCKTLAAPWHLCGLYAGKILEGLAEWHYHNIAIIACII